MSNENEAPALAGEVRRVRVPILGTCCVVEDGPTMYAYTWMPWRESWRLLYGDEAGSVFAAALRAERAGGETLKAAIRRITVDMPDDKPNGPTERALLDLESALDGFPWRDLAVDSARAAAARLCKAMADDAKALREAAESYFSEDFGKPTGGTT